MCGANGAVGLLAAACLGVGSGPSRLGKLGEGGRDALQVPAALTVPRAVFPEESGRWPGRIRRVAGRVRFNQQLRMHPHHR